MVDIKADHSLQMISRRLLRSREMPR